MKDCPYNCKAANDLKETIEFRGKSLALLETVAASIKEIKEGNRADDSEIWAAINKIRSDVQGLYWKVGLISGGSSLVISLVVTVVLPLVLGGKK